MTTSFVPNEYSEAEEAPEAKPLSRTDIAVGVFLGLCAWSLLLGIVYFILTKIAAA